MSDGRTDAQLPKELVIMGIPYRLIPCRNPVEADVYHRFPVFGQIDFSSRTVRVYVGDRPPEDILRTILHEFIHALVEQMHLKLPSAEDEDDEVDCLALGLLNLLQQNIWLQEMALGLPPVRVED
jgi:hypothetical protein